MLLVKIALELLIFIALILLIVMFVMTARGIRRRARAITAPHEEDLIHFDELMAQHEAMKQPRPDIRDRGA